MARKISRENQRKLLDELVRDIGMIDSVGVHLQISSDPARKLWNVIRARYKDLDPCSPPFNTYVRDLILKDSGVDINLRRDTANDILCQPGVVDELLEDNPMMFDDRQRQWLIWRASGMMISEICVRSNRLFDRDEYGMTQANVKFFLRSVREKLKEAYARMRGEEIERADEMFGRRGSWGLGEKRK